jgi:putative phosphoesterase
MAHLIGLISDTHGLLRSEVHSAFEGVELILHAGDVCGDDILQELRLIAPVQAVYGNNDPPGHPELTQSVELIFDGVRIHMSHGHELGRPKPEQVAARYDADVVVYGHTHKAVIAQIGTQLIINPGAAGPRRFDSSPTVAKLTIQDGVASAELISLD